MSRTDALVARVLGNLRRKLVMIHYAVLGMRPEWKKKTNWRRNVMLGPDRWLVWTDF